ncbi:MAG: amino acid adenylation domain-containing protein [Pseudomonadota bacterium]
MLFHALLDPAQALYMEQRWCTLRGELDMRAFRAAWEGVWQAHGVLRTAFHWRDGQSPMQWVDDEAQLDWREPDSRQVVDGASLQAWLPLDRAEGFALDRAPLMRCTLWRIAADEHLFVWTYHHLLMDGWSNGLLLREVLQRYEHARRAGVSAPATARSGPGEVPGFHRYLDWLARQDDEAAQACWREALAGLSEPTPLPELRAARPARSGSASHADAAHAGPDWSRTTLSLSPVQTQAIQEAARAWRVTMNTVVQGAWAVLLARQTGRLNHEAGAPAQVCFGAVSSGRPAALPDAAQMIGMFIQTLPVCVELDDAAPVQVWLRELQDKQARLEAHGHLGLARIQRASGLAPGVPLFEHILVYENYPLSSQSALGQPEGQQGTSALPSGLTLQDLGGHEQTHYPVALMVLPGTQLSFELRHDRQRLSDSVAHRWLERLQQTLLSLIDPQVACLGSIDVLPPSEKVWLRDAEALVPAPSGLTGIDDPGQPFTPVHAVVARQATRHGDQVIVVDHDHAHDALEAENLQRTWRWAAFENRVARLAGHLRELGVRHGDRVGVCLPRDADLLACWLAVHRAGAAYVPLDASHPPERLAMVLADAGLSHLISTSRPGGLLGLSPGPQMPDGLRLVDLSSEEWQHAQPMQAHEAPSLRPDDAAYVLFTSGSTGRPKGVVVGHGALDTFLRAMARAPGLGPANRLLATTTVAFDIAGLELFLPLLCGATLFIAPEGLARDPERLSACLLAHGIDTLQATPTTWRLLRDTMGLPPARTLRALVGGEALPLDLATWLLEGAAEVWNLYGPTETTIWSSALRLTAAHLPPSTADGGIPVGRPISGTRFVVRDADRRPVPAGVPGELCIGGLGLAQGYLDRPELTAAAYVPDPDAPGALLYRTGDLVSWRDDGLLNFLGRIDQQMKWRGHRIEAGEIEAALLAQPGVAQAAVLLRGPAGEASSTSADLVAFLVAQGDAVQPMPSATALQTALRQRLPAYMVPTRFVCLPALPQTPNNKVDRRALQGLPTPADSQGEDDMAAVSPQVVQGDDPMAALVASTWQRVLGLASLPADARFFDMGGHSLHVTQVMARLRQTLGVDLPLQLLFDHPALPDFIGAVRARRGAADAAVTLPQDAVPAGLYRLPEAQRRGPLPLLPSQRRQCLMAQQDPASAAYTIPLFLSLQGPLDPQTLLSTWAMIVQRHDALRMAFVPGVDPGAPSQGYLQEAQAVLQAAGCLPVDPAQWAVDLNPGGDVGAEALQALAEAQVRAWVAEPFDLRQAPLWRLRLLRLSPQAHWLVLTVHHILLDDASLGIIAREWHQLHACAVQGGPAWDSVCRSWQTPRADLAEAMQAAASSDDDMALERARCHWQQVLSAPLVPLALHQVHQVETTTSPSATLPLSRRAHRLSRTVSAATLARLRTMVGERGLTLYMVLLAGFGALMRRHASTEDLLLATPVAGRIRPEWQTLVGMFVNTVPLRLKATGHQDVGQWLDQVRAVTLAAFEHQALPFEDILAQMPQAVEGTACPVLFSLQNAHGQLPQPEAGGLHWAPLSTGTGQAKADLSLMLQPTPDGQGLTACWEARASCLDMPALARMASHYETMLDALAHDPACPLAALPLLTPDEDAALREWSKGPQAFPGGPDTSQGSLLTAFVQQARRTPQAVALRDGARSWTYAALLQQAASLAMGWEASAAWAQAPSPKAPMVALWAERSAETLIGLLAVVLAGGCHVPLDPQAPEARQRDIVRRCQAPMLLVPHARAMAQADAVFSLDSFALQIVDLSTDLARDPAHDAAAIDAWLDQQLILEATHYARDRLACVMHTSGSTGEPKGVCVTHHAILRLVQPQPALHYGADEVWLQAAPLAFDASTLEIWGAWLHGARLVVAPQALEIDALGALIRREEVSSLWLTAGLFKLLVDERLDDLACVRQLVAGGDVLSVPHVRRLMARWPGIRMVNGYGPTETTTFACCHPIETADLDSGPIPIGRPIVGTSVRVLDAHGQPQPVGVPGELHIGGAGLARGYLDNPVATASSFVPDPQPDLDDFDEGAHVWSVYRTGDLVAWRDDGSLVFLGRCDRQLKIRGFRVEPGEVEAALGQHPQVRRVAVVPRSDPSGHVHLVAYPVWHAHAGEPPAWAVLRAWLADRLPPHLLPSSCIPVAELPLNANGKLDVRALPMPSWSDEPADATQAPEHDEADGASPTARRLLALWRELLPGRRIGLHDNFFDLGGDSIVAMQLVSRARAAGLSFTPAQVLQHQTVVALAEVCGAAPSDEDDALWLTRHPYDPERLPLTPVQRWWLDQQGFDADRLPTHHNQAVCLSLPEGTDRALLQTTLHAVVARHDAFRWRLRIDDPRAGWQGRLLHSSEPTVRPPIAWHELRALSDAEQAQRIDAQADAAHAAVDLVQGPVWRAVGWDLGPGKGLRLLLTVHHFVIDAVSWRVLLDEWRLAWRQAQAGQPLSLGPRPRGLTRWALSLQARQAEVGGIPSGDAAGAACNNRLALTEEVAGSLPVDTEHALDQPTQVGEAQVLERELCLPDVGLSDDPRLPQALSMQDTLLIALARTLSARIPQADALSLTLESHGRWLPAEASGTEVSAADTGETDDNWHGVGWYTALCPAHLPLKALGAFAIPPSSDLAGLASAWKAPLAQGQAWGMELAGGAVPSPRAPAPAAISFNHLGQLPPDDLGDGWRRVPVPGRTRDPAQRRAHLIEVDTCQRDGRWILRWTFSERHHRAATIASWMDDWVAHWLEVLGHLQGELAHQQASGQDFDLDESELALALSQVRFSETS